LPTLNQVREVIIEIVCAELGDDLSLLRRRLTAGEEVPLDSLTGVEVLVRVEERFGVRVPETVETARALRSINGFAKLIADFANSKERTRK
jgi:acyl carrier protein